MRATYTSYNLLLIACHSFKNFTSHIFGLERLLTIESGSTSSEEDIDKIKQETIVDTQLVEGLPPLGISLYSPITPVRSITPTLMPRWFRLLTLPNQTPYSRSSSIALHLPSHSSFRLSTSCPFSPFTSSNSLSSYPKSLASSSSSIVSSSSTVPSPPIVLTTA